MMLNYLTHYRSFMMTAACYAVKNFKDPLFFLRLLNRPPQQRPKIGELSPNGEGKKFTQSIQSEARNQAANQCVFCAENTTTKSPVYFSNRSEIDHAIPISRGGNSSINNAQNTCHDCNTEKANLTTTEFLLKRHGPEGLKLLAK